MDIKAIKELAQKYTKEELLACADALENTGTCIIPIKEEPSDTLSDLLQAAEIRSEVDAGKPLQDAIRDFSRRVREIISAAKR